MRVDIYDNSFGVHCVTILLRYSRRACSLSVEKSFVGSKANCWNSFTSGKWVVSRSWLWVNGPGDGAGVGGEAIGI